jgi:hypothetical protein
MNSEWIMKNGGFGKIKKNDKRQNTRAKTKSLEVYDMKERSILKNGCIPPFSRFSSLASIILILDTKYLLLK